MSDKKFLPIVIADRSLSALHYKFFIVDKSLLTSIAYRLLCELKL